jgi:hypothetical protein
LRCFLRAAAPNCGASDGGDINMRARSWTEGGIDFVAVRTGNIFFASHLRIFFFARDDALSA